MARRLFLVVGGLLVVWAAWIALPGAARPAGTGGGRLPPALVLDPPLGAGELSWPVALAHAGDARLFVVEQSGRIKIIENGAVRPIPFLDISNLVIFYEYGEEGLLGLAFHPDYVNNGYFYVYYVNLDGDLAIARYSRSPTDPNIADPNSGVILLVIPHPNHGNHSGGQLAFGPDGYLYLGPGDGGDAGDPPNNAQNRGVLLGKILRIDVNVPDPTPYAIPTTNPFYGQAGARGEIWAWGLRNPWRFSFDSQTGDLLIGDVGQDNWEEVDFQPAGDPGGTNYGWRLWEGMHCYNPPSDCTPTPEPTPPPTPVRWATPVTEYWSNNGECAVIGGYVYHGTQSPALTGIYLYGDYCSGRIRGLWPTGGSWTSAVLLNTGLNILSFGQDVQGELYVASNAGVQHVRALGPRLLAPLIAYNPLP
jgi:glucose/arabinose dehydrogenase